MHICFRDGTMDPSDVCTDPGWQKSPSRKLLAYVYDQFKLINRENPVDNAPPKYNKADLYRQMQRHLEIQDDYNPDKGKPSIVVWASTPSRQYYNIGLCLLVQFSEIGMNAVAAVSSESQSRANAVSDALQLPHFSPFIGLADPWDSNLVVYEDNFFRVMTSVDRWPLQTLAVVVIGRLSVHYIVVRMIAAAELGAIPTGLCKDLLRQIRSHPITSTYQVQHLWASEKKAKDGVKNHPYPWSKLFEMEIPELIGPARFNPHSVYHGKAQKEHTRHHHFVELSLGGLASDVLASGFQQLMTTGSINVETLQILENHVDTLASSNHYSHFNILPNQGAEYNTAMNNMWQIEHNMNQRGLQILLMAKIRYAQSLIEHRKAPWVANPVRQFRRFRSFLKQWRGVLKTQKELENLIKYVKK